MPGSVSADRLTADRWCRFGHDRLYVRRDGAPIGWWDLVADSPRATSPEEEDTLQAAVHLWRDAQLLPGGAGAVSPVAPVLPTVPPPAVPQLLAPVVPPSSLPPADRDLASNEPGATLLAHLASLREGGGSPPAGPLPSRPPGVSWFRRLLAWVLDPGLGRRAGVPGDPTTDRPWLIGAAGEQRVGAALSVLTRREPLWQALHSIPAGSRGSDIDHVVMGPGGVYTLNTKHHRRRRVWVGGDVVLLGGQYQPYVRNSRHEAARASRLLSAACGFPVPVRGLVVVVGAHLRVKAQPADVVVLDERGLGRWLREQPVRLDTAALSHVYAAARRASTWTRPHR